MKFFARIARLYRGLVAISKGEPIATTPPCDVLGAVHCTPGKSVELAVVDGWLSWRPTGGNDAWRRLYDLSDVVRIVN